MLRCAVCYRWMAHLALIVVYIEFTWNYVRFNKNDYYFMIFMNLQKSPNYTNKSLNYFTVSDSWIPVWVRCAGRPDWKKNAHGEYIFLFCICEKNYIYNYYKKSAEIYMICQTIRIRIRNAWEISQAARKAKLKLKELDNCQVGDQWPVSDEIHSRKW